MHSRVAMLWLMTVRRMARGATGRRRHTRRRPHQQRACHCTSHTSPHHPQHTEHGPPRHTAQHSATSDSAAHPGRYHAHYRCEGAIMILQPHIRRLDCSGSSTAGPGQPPECDHLRLALVELLGRGCWRVLLRLVEGFGPVACDDMVGTRHSCAGSERQVGRFPTTEAIPRPLPTESRAHSIKTRQTTPGNVP